MNRSINKGRIVLTTATTMITIDVIAFYSCFLVSSFNMLNALISEQSKVWGLMFTTYNLR